MATTLLRADAAWTWFHDPRALHAAEHTYITWSATTGIWVGQRRDSDGTWNEFQLRATGGVDDHHVAAVGRRADGRLIAAYSDHSDTVMRVRISTDPDSVVSWDAETTPVTAGEITYPNLVHLSTEGRWYLFYRNGALGTGSPWAFISSDDDGDTWSEQTQLTVENTQVIYCKIVSDGADQIHFLLTDGHPDQTDVSVYHLHYDAGQWRNSTITIGTPPFAHTSLTKIHDGVAGDNSWIWDIAIDDGVPVCVFATFPSTTDHRYQYARLSAGAWVVREVTPAGGSIDNSGADPHYSGGIALDQADPSVIYLSRQAGTNAWDIEQWVTADQGVSWTSQTVATGDKHMRPVGVRNVANALIWFAGRYDSFTDFDTSLFYATILAAPSPPSPPIPSPVVAIRPEIEWYGCDLVSGRIIAPIPDIVGDVERILGGYTTASLTVPITPRGPVPLTTLLQATAPKWRTMVVAVVNDLPAWAGIVTRRRRGTGPTMALSCSTLEMYFTTRKVRDHTLTNKDEATIAAVLAGDADTIPGVAGGGIGLVIDAPATGTLRDRTYETIDRQTVYDRLQELMNVDDGPEWTIDLDWTDSTRTTIAKIFRVRKRIGVTVNAMFQSSSGAMISSIGSSDAVYDLDEDSGVNSYANFVVAYSTGQEHDQPQSVPAVDTDALNAGAPIVERHFQPSTSISTQTVLDAHAAAELSRLAEGANLFEITARFDAYPRYGVDWQLGDDVQFELHGHGHPDGVQGQARIIGFAVDFNRQLIIPKLLHPTGSV